MIDEKQLIERLEESKAKFVFGIKGTSLLECMEVNAINIIATQLAEEYKLQKPKTNFDRIKAMSLEEMACWIHGIDHYVDDSETMVNLGNETLDDNLSDIMDWLQQEVEE